LRAARALLRGRSPDRPLDPQRPPLSNSEGGSAPLPNLPPKTGCAGKARARTRDRQRIPPQALNAAPVGPWQAAQKGPAAPRRPPARPTRPAPPAADSLGGGLCPPSAPPPEDRLRGQSPRSNA